MISLVSHLIWEIIQLPLYTIWSTASPHEIAFAVLHCTAGDLLIALATLMGSLAVIGDREWPNRGRLRIAGLTVFGGLIYTIFSEWLNTGVRGSWAYSDLMPTLPPIGTGLSPLLQWVLIPTLSLAAMGRISQDVPDADPSPGD